MLHIFRAYYYILLYFYFLLCTFMKRFKLINQFLRVVQIVVAVILTAMLVKAMKLLFIFISGEIAP